MQLSCFNKPSLGGTFYNLNKKIVPINIYDLLTPRGFARIALSARASPATRVTLFGFRMTVAGMVRACI